MKHKNQQQLRNSEVRHGCSAYKTGQVALDLLDGKMIFTNAEPNDSGPNFYLMLQYRNQYDPIRHANTTYNTAVMHKLASDMHSQSFSSHEYRKSPNESWSFNIN